MEFDELIKKRRSVRSFEKKPVDFRKILEAIDAANQGPFAGNHNTMHYVIIEDAGTIKRIAEHAQQSWIANAPAMIVVCSDDTNLENIYGERGRVYAKQQSGAAIITLIFKLVEAGLSTCWVGAFTDEVVKTTLGIPLHIQIEAILPIGHGKEEKHQPKHIKKELATTIFWEGWRRSRRPTLFKEGPLRQEKTTFGGF